MERGIFSAGDIELSACVNVGLSVLNVTMPSDFAKTNYEDHKQVIKTLTLNFFNIFILLSCLAYKTPGNTHVKHL
jgi:hypothetical protein